MNWNPNTKTEELLKGLFETKSNMAKELNLSRNTVNSYLANPEKLNSLIRKIAKLKRISEIELFKSFNS